MIWSPPIKLYHAGIESVDCNDYYLDCSRGPHGPTRILLKYTISGEGSLWTPDGKITLRKGDLFLISRPSEFKYGYKGDGNPWEFAYLSIKIPGDPSLFLPDFFKPHPVLGVSERDPLLKRFLHLIGLRESNSFKDHHAIDAYQIYLRFIRRIHGERALHPQVIALKKLMDDGCKTGLRVGDFCAQLPYRKETLIRLFRDAFGDSPGGYLSKRKLDEARALLQTNKSIEEISQEIGFSSSNYFIRFFRKQVGESPNQYRRSWVSRL